MKVDEIFLDPDIAGANLRLVKVQDWVYRETAQTTATCSLVKNVSKVVQSLAFTVAADKSKVT